MFPIIHKWGIDDWWCLHVYPSQRNEKKQCLNKTVRNVILQTQSTQILIIYLESWHLDLQYQRYPQTQWDHWNLVVDKMFHMNKVFCNKKVPQWWWIFFFCLKEIIWPVLANYKRSSAIHLSVLHLSVFLGVVNPQRSSDNADNQKAACSCHSQRCEEWGVSCNDYSKYS